MIEMSITYEIVSEGNASLIKDLVDELMAFQKSKAYIHKEFFDGMSFETRMPPALKSARENFIVAARDDGRLIGYAYSTVAPKEIYSDNFATLKCHAFFDFDSVKTEDVGCLSQFYIKEEYRCRGIGSELFERSMEWLRSHEAIKDIFIFVSNGNDNALKFYTGKGFKVSHDILDGFITVLRNS
jgi:GNAT superfamily N-acetyltransferase